MVVEEEATEEVALEVVSEVVLVEALEVATMITMAEEVA